MLTVLRTVGIVAAIVSFVSCGGGGGGGGGGSGSGSGGAGGSSSGSSGTPTALTLTVAKTGTGSGTITSSPSGINCGTACSQSNIVKGTSIALIGTADNGSIFAGWTAISGMVNNQDGTCCKVTIDSDKAVTAIFNASSSSGTTSPGTTSPGTTSPTATSRLKWAFVTDPIYHSSPAIGDDGTIYFGTSHWDLYAGTRPIYGVYAVRPDGTLKWKYATGSNSPARGGPAIGLDGTLYIVIENKDTAVEELYALDPAGAFRWKYVVNPSKTLVVGASTPAIGADGTIYVNGKGLYAINRDGTLKWMYSYSGGETHSSPAIGADGTIYAVCMDVNTARGFPIVEQAICTFGPEGNVRWRYFTGGDYILSSPALGADGTIYVGGAGGILYAISSAGTLKWSYKSGRSDIRSSAAVGSDGTIYVGSYKGSDATPAWVLAVNPDGTLKWKYDTAIDVSRDSDIYSSPAIGADGTIYIVSEDSWFYAFNPDGTLKWKDNSIAGVYGGFTWSSPPIVSDGTMYIGGLGGALVAIKSDSLGLANTSWPKYHYDNKITGRSRP